MRLASVIALVLAAAAGTAIETSGWQASSPATVTTAQLKQLAYLKGSNTKAGDHFGCGGVLDGLPGFIVSVMNAYYVFLKFARLWELERTARKPGSKEAWK